MSTVGVLREVRNERRRQDEKWGPVQDIPFGTGSNQPLGSLFGMLLVDARHTNDHGAPTFESVLREEFLEAALVDPRDQEHLREELIQVAAVAVKAVEHIDRRAA